MKNILVAVDFSSVTPLVLKEAKKLANSTGGRIRLIHVAPPEPDFVGDDVGPQILRDQKAKEFREAHKKIQKLADEIKEDNIEVTPLLIQGVTVDEIINESNKMNADIIVIGSHGHGAMYNLLMGSVVEGVIRESKTPVLVVPAKN